MKWLQSLAVILEKAESTIVSVSRTCATFSILFIFGFHFRKYFFYWVIVGGIRGQEMYNYVHRLDHFYSFWMVVEATIIHEHHTMWVPPIEWHQMGKQNFVDEITKCLSTVSHTTLTSSTPCVDMIAIAETRSPRTRSF